MLALVGDAAGLVHVQGLRHDPVELPAVVAHIVEGLAEAVFRIAVRQGEIEIPDRVDPLLFGYGVGVFRNGHPPPRSVKNLNHR